METFLLMLILTGTIYYVIAPYLRKTPATQPGISKRARSREELLERRDRILASIKDLEFEKEVGKISEQDFREMNARFRREAVAVMRELESAAGNTRKKRRPSKNRRFCTACGAVVTRGDRFCLQCGHRLR